MIDSRRLNRIVRFARPGVLVGLPVGLVIAFCSQRGLSFEPWRFYSVVIACMSAGGFASYQMLVRRDRT